MLVVDVVAAVLDHPMGGCVRVNAVVAKEGPEELDRPGASSRPAALPIVQGYLKITKEFDPKGEHAPGANHLRIPTALVED